MAGLDLPVGIGAAGLLVALFGVAFRLILFGDRVRREAYELMQARAETAEKALDVVADRLRRAEHERDLWRLEADRLRG